MKVQPGGSAIAVFEGMINMADGERPFRNEQGLLMLPDSFGVRWTPSSEMLGGWTFSHAWVHGQAVKRDGTVGWTGRYARYWPKDQRTMPGWLRAIAAVGPIHAEGQALQLAETDLSV